VGAGQKREVRSRLTRLCQHLLKRRYQPDHRSRSWRTTIYLQRNELQDLFKDSPSLRPFAQGALASAYVSGRQAAEAEAGLFNLPGEACPWSLDEVIDFEFLPD
jgi:hypothetical protein